jgi:hypothetical protein
MASKVLDLQVKAQKCLEQTREFLRSRTIKDNNGWGLDQFLDESNTLSNHIGIFGTSCGVSTLLICGEPPESTYIKNYKDWLVFRKEEDGGWTLSEIHKKDTLTTATCYVLNALSDTGEYCTSPLVREGLDWLVRTQNPDFGWGLFESDQESKIIATSEVLLTFSKYKEYLNREATIQAINWLINSHNTDNCWGVDCKTSSLLGTTALALLALNGAGYPSCSPCIDQPTRWLMERHLEEYHTDREIYTIPYTDRVEYYHLPALSLGLKALLIAETDPTQTKILQMVDVLVSKQMGKGYWKDETTADKIPIWATLYACQALKEFVIRVEKIRGSIELREKIVELNQASQQTQEKVLNNENLSKELSKQITELGTVLELTKAEVAELSGRVGSLESKRTILNRFVKSFFSKISSFLRKFWPHIVLVISSLVMGIMYLTVNDQIFINISFIVYGVIAAITTGLIVLKIATKK